MIGGLAVAMVQVLCVVQVMECVYPYRQPLPVQQRLRHEAEYRLLQLLRWREGEDDPVRIRLEELLQFEQIRALCSSTEGIR